MRPRTKYLLALALILTVLTCFRLGVASRAHVINVLLVISCVVAYVYLTFLLALCALLFHHADDWLLYIYAVGAALITVLAVGRLSIVQIANPFWCFILGFLAVFLAIMALALVIYGQIVIAAMSANH